MSQLLALRRSLREILTKPFLLTPVPKALGREIAQLERWVGSAGSIGGPRDAVRDAVVHFWQSGRLESIVDARLACFGVLERFEPHGKALIEEESRFPALLSQIERLSLEPRPFRRCYRGLIYSYFAYDPDTAGVGSVGERNWTRLRAYLEAGFGRVRLQGIEPDWVGCLSVNQNLLTSDPVRRYADAALRGDTSEFADVRRVIEIPETSWLVRRLVLSQVEVATGKVDAEFKPLIDPLLDVLAEHPVIRDQGLALLAERYGRATEREQHIPLREAGIGAWGNPLLQANRPRWGRLNDDTRRMFAGWITADLIQQFFTVLAEDGRTDQRRVRFWQRFHRQMDTVYFVLGTKARWSHSPDTRRLRELMGSQQLALTQGGVAANNAFIMMMGEYAIVEFGLTGNACFIFDRKKLPFQLAGAVPGNSAGLKHASHIDRLLHIEERWEGDFERALAKVGILPDADQVQTGSRRRTSPTPQPTARSNVPSPSETPLTSAALRAFANYHGLEISDKTPQGGSLFVNYSGQGGPVAEQLARWGFRYGPTKRAWYRNGGL